MGCFRLQYNNFLLYCYLCILVKTILHNQMYFWSGENIASSWLTRTAIHFHLIQLFLQILLCSCEFRLRIRRGSKHGSVGVKKNPRAASSFPPNRFSPPWEHSNVGFTMEDESFAFIAITVLQSSTHQCLERCFRKLRESQTKTVSLAGREKEHFQLFLWLMFLLQYGKYQGRTEEVKMKVLDYCKKYEVSSLSKHETC